MRRALLLFALVLAAAVAGCGGSDDSGSGDDPQLTVVGASSLQEAFEGYAKDFSGAKVRTSFAGSDTLAAQIRQGAAPDVFASADTSYPAELHSEGLLEEPVVFAANELVIAVPADSPIESLADLAEPDTTIVTGDATVPVGAYTAETLDRLPAAEKEAILANVRSREPEVSAVVAKVLGGAADAGFVYATDVKTAGDELRAVKLPQNLKPEVAYAAGVVSGSGEQELSERFLDGLLTGKGAAELRRVGFLPPP